MSFLLRPRIYFSMIAVASGTLGIGHGILSETRKPPHLITESEFKDTLFELKGQEEHTSFNLSELASLGEDGNCQGIVGHYRCWGIFDGHSGWCTSNYVSNHILGYLNETYEKRRSTSSWPWSLISSGKPAQEDIDSKAFDEVITDAFTKLDNDILQAPLKALTANNPALAAQSLPIAVSGACAMMAFYNPFSHLLKVALVGDSRTVFGVQDTKGVWHATNLTIDQTGGNPTEIARIRGEHPTDPPRIVNNGRVLGYQPSRAFGDGATKYTKDQINALRNTFWMRRQNDLALSPPYLTAKPVISTVEIDPSRPSFLVMGCDGLYEWLSNEQLVSLVGKWLEKNPVIPTKAFAGVQDHSSGYDSAEVTRPKILGWGELQPVVKDDNAASHLIRNALGGADFQKVSLLMSIPSPMSRQYRDDITCTVVFFMPSRTSKL